MKKNFLFITLIVCCTTVTASSVGKQKARQKAAAFIAGKTATGTATKRAAANSSMLTDAGSPASGNFYVFNVGNSQGFVIVSNNDSTPEVLAYSDSGHLNMDNLPDNLKQWLLSYDEQISIIKRGSRKMPRRTPLTPIAPLIPTEWGQGSPYNLLCPTLNAELPLTGCVATAMAQVMYYFKWPQGSTKATAAYTGVNGSYDGLPATTFDWDDMLTSYSCSSTETQKMAVAKLMQYCGSAVRMNYGYGGAESLTGNNMIAPFMQQYFGYASTGKQVQRSNYDSDGWEELIYGELVAGRPVIYGGANENGSGGHTFVCDGCDTDGRFHINWGWNGGGNGYYYLTALYPEGYTNRYVSDDAVIGIQYDGWEERFNIKANDITRYYGDENPTLTYTMGNGIEGSGEPLLECDATLESPVGTYPIRISKGSITDGRAVYVEGTLTVKPAKLTIKGPWITIKRNAPIPAFEPTYSGWKLDQDASVLKVQPTLTCDVTSTAELGQYDIIVSGAEADNYDISYSKGRLTVEANTVAVTVEEVNYNLDVDMLTAEVTYKNPAYSGNKTVQEEIVYEGKTYKVTTVGNSAFRYGSELISVKLPNSIVEIKDNAFAQCDKLESVNMPKNLTTIGYQAFGNCKVMQNVILPPTLKSIGGEAFRVCYALTSITIPTSVETISSQAFQYCENLKTFIVKSKVPITIYAYSLNYLTSRATLYVPKGCKAAYEAAQYWKDFNEIVELKDTGDVNGDDDITAQDASLILQAVAGKIVLTDTQIAVADVNNDGEVTAQDASLILQKVAGKITW